MEQIKFYTAKNGQETCSINNINIHSSYDPDKESSRFVDAIDTSINPAIILITEPGLSYCIKFLRIKFPKTKLIAIRYSNSFEKYNENWDYVFNFYDYNCEQKIYSELSNKFTDEEICSALFLSWQPSSKIYQNNEKIIWEVIKKLVIKSRTVLFTRSYFSSRWLINQINFCKNIKNIYTIKKGSSNVIITASGPSLKTSLPFIQKNRNNFFLIAVSSSVKTLLHNKIIPNLIITTDGGWWAKKHIESINNFDIPIALPLEANIQKKFLQTKKIIPLKYSDGIETNLLDICKINSYNAERNGTVSGTALDFALSITTGKIYFFGLDLATSKGYQHTQPNSIEVFNTIYDNRIKTKELRSFKSEINTEALEIYKEWFQNKSESLNNVFRVSNNYNYNNNLGKINDINIQDVEINNINDIEILNSSCNNFDSKQSIQDFINKNYTTENWKKEFFPTEYIAYEKSIDSDEKKSRLNQIEEKNNKLYKKIWKILNE